jgi:hypothetical protein
MATIRIQSQMIATHQTIISLSRKPLIQRGGKEVRMITKHLPTTWTNIRRN